MSRLPGLVVLLVALAGAAPAAADWSAAAPVPVVQPADARQASVDAELADNGDAAVAWDNTVGDVLVATRTAGSWSLQKLPFGGESPAVEGDGRGGFAVAWHSGNDVCAGYRPAGGEWGLPASRAQCYGAGTAYDPVFARPGLSVNRRGDVLLTWLQNEDWPFDAMAATRPAATGAWGPAEQVATNLTGTDDRGRPGLAGAIDDAGNALVAWDADYATVKEDDKVSAIRVGMRPAGASAWGAPQDVTPTDPGPDGCAGHPSWFNPRLAVDPVSGAIALAYYGSDDYYSEAGQGCSPSGETAIVWAGGSTTAGASGGTRSPPYLAATVAGAPGWLMGAATTSTPNPKAVLAAVGPSGSLSPSTLPGSEQGTGNAMIDVGARGRALVWRDGSAWLSGPGGAFSGPVAPVLPQGQGDFRYAGASINCQGAALLSAPRAADGTVYFAEHAGDPGDAACASPGGGEQPPPPPPGGGGDPPPGGGGPGPAPPTPPAVVPAADTTGPVVTIPSKSKSLRMTRGGVVPFRLGPVAENTTGVLSLKTDGKVRAGGKRKVLALGTKAFQALKGQQIVIRIKLPKAGRKLVARRGRAKLKATITLRDATGNATVKPYKLVVKAPKRR